MITLHVSEARTIDVGRGIARIDPRDLEQLKARTGDILRLQGKKPTVVKVMPNHLQDRNTASIQVDGIIRSNAGVSLGDPVQIERVEAQAAKTVALQALEGEPLPVAALSRALEGLPVITGDIVRFNRIGVRPQRYSVMRTQPEGAVLINRVTRLSVVRADSGSIPSGVNISYEDIGGLDREIRRIREMVELPMRFPQAFQHLGISPPKGVLIYGPPGSGKTLIARALAHETNANFIAINGPEVIDKFYGQSEAALRRVFEEAHTKAPSIVFIDEIDAIAPKRSEVQGEVEKRVVAQLLSLLDGLEDRGDIVVIGATNLPDRLDPALRRPGRFDREISIGMPDRHGREAILTIHARSMPLAGDVDLSHLAAITHGYVGADLQALCREAAMHALRRFLPEIEDLRPDSRLLDELPNLVVCAEDWDAALLDVFPSVTRGVLAETPDVKWSDIGGLEEAKAALQQAIEWPLLHSSVFEQAGLKSPHGILLSGSPGTGKTLLAKAVASEMEVNFIGMRGPELVSKWVGESERGVREIFHTARLAAPCVIFFDEFDSIAPRRTGTDPVLERVVAQLLTEIDGLQDLHGVIVLAATNRPDLIDPALLRSGRLDVHIEVGLPDAAARQSIFEIHLARRAVNSSLNTAELSDQTEGWSGAEIAEWCRRATLLAVIRVIEQGEPLVITADDLDFTRDEVKRRKS